jgi:hypothetical protein
MLQLVLCGCMCMLGERIVQNKELLTHIHRLAEGGRLVVRRLPDAGIHHKDDQVLQEMVAS